MARAFFLGSALLYLVLGFRMGASGFLLSWLGLSLLVIGLSYVVGSARLMASARTARSIRSRWRSRPRVALGADQMKLASEVQTR